MSATVESAPEKEGHSAHPALALALICIAQLMIVLDGTIANIALPFIQSDLGFSNAGLTWVVTIYALSFGGLLLLGGRLGDVLGRRRIFAIGLVVFAIASALGGLATSEGTLLAARALQGVGGALASPAALALITTTFPAGPERNRAFGVYAAMSAAGAAIGLLLGGWLTGLDFSMMDSEHAGWRLTFLINVPLGVIGAWLAGRWLMESDAHETSLDIPGAVLGTGGLFSLVYGLSRAGDDRYGWGDSWTITWLVLGAVLLAVFVLVEMRTEHALLPFTIFADASRASSLFAMMLMPAAMFSMFFYLSIYVQRVMGYSPEKTGWAFLPISGGILVTAAIVSQLVSRVDARWLSGFGLVLVAGALFGFSRIPYADTTFPVEPVVASYASDILPFILLMAVGMGLVFIPLTLTAVHGIPDKDSGIGSGVLNTMQQVGGALGLALLATVASQAWTDRGAAFAKAGEAAQKAAMEAGAPPPSPEEMEAVGQTIGLQVYTYGATQSFQFGIFLALGAAVAVLLFLKVKHTEVGQASPGAGMH